MKKIALLCSFIFTITPALISIQCSNSMVNKEDSTQIKANKLDSAYEENEALDSKEKSKTSEDIQNEDPKNELSNANNPEIQEDILDSKEESPTTENVQNENKLNLKNDATLSENRNHLFVVEEDGLYLIANDYSGELRNNTGMSGTQVATGIVPIPKQNNSWNDNVVMLGNNDSFYVLYDEDDEDGLSSDNFLDTIYWLDTSIAKGKNFENINSKLGNTLQRGDWSLNTYTKFVEGSESNKGQLNLYVGAQNNHHRNNNDPDKNLQLALQTIYKVYENNREVYEAILKYYGFKTQPESDGTFSDDPLIENHAHRGFIPVVNNKPIFTWERIEERAIKITYHFEESFSTTAANMVIKRNDKFEEYGLFSVGGENEHQAYRQSRYKFVGYKPIPAGEE